MITFKQDPQNKKVFLKIERMADDILYAVERAYLDVGHLLRDSLQKGLKFGKRRGRTYTHFKNGRYIKRQSSAPGEYPQRIYGVLRGAVAFTVLSHKQMVFGIKNPGKGGVDTEYAEELENGSSRIKKRKLVGYTVNKEATATRNLFIKKIDEEVKKL